MRTSNLSKSQLLRIAACILLDIAILAIFLNIFPLTFPLFTVLNPIKTVIMLLVLVLSLVVTNAVILFYNYLYSRFGIVYTVAIIFFTFSFGAIANIISALAIPMSAFYYIVWELVNIAAYLIILSIINVFARKVESDNNKVELEQLVTQSVRMQLMNVETTLATTTYSNDMTPVKRSVKELKETIESATPFGRIIGNQSITDIEQTVQNNLEYIMLQIKLDLSDADINELQRMIRETRILIMNRESLNIK